MKKIGKPCACHPPANGHSFGPSMRCIRNRGPGTRICGLLYSETVAPAPCEHATEQREKSSDG